MIVLLVLLCLAVVLAILGLAPDLVLKMDTVAWLQSANADVWLGGACLVWIVLAVMAYAKCVRTWQRQTVWSVFGVGVMAMFIIRSLMAYHDFQAHSITRSHTVSATVVVRELSDTVVDEYGGGGYRHVVMLKDIKPLHNSHRHAGNSVLTTNPFGADDSDAEQVVFSDEMTVLLMAFPNQINQLPNLNQLTPNTSAAMTLTLEPIGSSAYFDDDKWLRSRHVHAYAKVMSVGDVKQHHPDGLMGVLQAWRQSFRDAFYEQWHEYDIQTQQAKAVTLSLLTGDRALISRATKELYQLAGISHLLAISGAHVVFLAMMMANISIALTNRLMPKIYQYVLRWQIRTMVLLSVGLMYALFTGFDVPAMRTVYMLFTVALVRHFGLPIGSMTALAVVAGVMVWLDPYVVWQAGFWLSFVAVMLLMRYEQAWFQAQAPSAQSLQLGFGLSVLGRLMTSLGVMIRLQCWLFVAMLPISLLLFDKVSLWGLPTNLFAVGFFGAIIVPINLLAGVLSTISQPLAQVLWQVCVWLLGVMHGAMDWLAMSSATHAWLYVDFGILGLVLFMLVIAVLMSGVLPKVSMALPALALMMVLTNRSVSSDAVIIKTLDVQDDKISVHLLKHHQQNWLMMANFGDKSMQDKHLIKLVDELKSQGVYQLSGVIVQTPDDKMPLYVANLHEHVRVLQYWQAGGSTQHLAQLSIQDCQAGKQHQQDGLSIQVLTGWHFHDEKVVDCVVQIDSEHVIAVQQDDLSSQSHRIVVNAAKDELLWRLWQMVCPPDEQKGVLPKPPASYAQADDASNEHSAIWLSSPYAKMPANMSN